MPETSRDSSSCAAAGPGRRKRRVPRFLVRSVVALLLLAIILGAALAATMRWWAPWAVARAAARKTHTRVEIGACEFWPAGQVTIRNLRVGLPGDSQDAIAIGTAKVTYKRFADLLRGSVGTVALDDLRIQETQVLRLAGKIREIQAPGSEEEGGAVQQIHKHLFSKAPQGLEVRNAVFVRPSGKVFTLRSFAARSATLAGGVVRLSLSLETSPLDTMLPLSVPDPLKAECGLALTSKTVRVISLRSNLGSLLEMREAQTRQPLEFRGSTFDLKGTHADPNAWFRALGVPLPGECEADVRLDRLTIGTGPGTAPATTGLGPEALHSGGQIELDIPAWDDFAPGWSASGAVSRVEAQAAASQDLRTAWLKESEDWKVASLETPVGRFEDIRANMKSEGNWKAGELQWQNAAELFAAKTSLCLPRKSALRFGGSATGTLLTSGPLSLAVRFDLDPRLEVENQKEIALPVKGLFGLEGGAGVNLLTLFAEGKAAGGSFNIEASGSPGRGLYPPRAEAEMDLKGVSFDEMERIRGLAGWKTGVSPSGEGSAFVGVRLDGEGTASARGTLRLERFSLRRKGKPPFLKKPVDIAAMFTVSGPAAPYGFFDVSWLSLEAPPYFSLDSRGTASLSTNTLALRGEPAFEIRSLAALAALAGWTLPFDAAATARGKAEFARDQDRLRAAFDGNAALQDLRADFPRRSGDPPTTATRVRSFSLGSLKTRGKTGLEIKARSRALTYDGDVDLRKLAVFLERYARPHALTTASLALDEAHFHGRADVPTHPAGNDFVANSAVDLKGLRFTSGTLMAEIAQTSLTLLVSSTLPSARDTEPSLRRTSIRFSLPPTPVLLRVLPTPTSLSTSTQVVVRCTGTVRIESSTGAHPQIRGIETEIDRVEIQTEGGGKLESCGPSHWRGRIRLRDVFECAQTLDVSAQNVSTLFRELRRAGIPGVDKLRPLDTRLTSGTLQNTLQLTSGTLQIRNGRQSLTDSLTQVAGLLTADSVQGSIANSWDADGKINPLVTWRGLTGQADISLSTPQRLKLSEISTRTLIRMTAKAKGAFRIAEILAAGGQFTDLNLIVRSADKKVFLEGVSFKSYGGDGTIATETNLNTWPTSLSLQANIYGVDLETFVRDYDLKGRRMAGKVNVEVDLLFSPAKTLLEARVTQASPKIWMDMKTAANLHGFWIASLTGMNYMLGRAPSQFQKMYKPQDLLEYDTFTIHCRYDHQKRIYENTVVLRNPSFRTTFTVNMEARVVAEYLKWKQKESLRLKQRGVLTGPPPPKPSTSSS
jgi:hypothetical protein